MTLRKLARVSVAFFAVSTAFPVAAGVLNLDPAPRWLGIADVAVAAVMFLVVATVATRARQGVTDSHRLSAFRISQRVSGAIPVMLVIYFVAGPRINWSVLVIGLAWRAWLLLYSSPMLVAALTVVPPVIAPDPRPQAR